MNIAIQDNGDGTFNVQPEQGDAQPAQDVAQVCQIVESLLGGEGGDAQAMWDQEATKRQPQQPAAGDSGAQGGPSMSL